MKQSALSSAICVAIAGAAIAGVLTPDVPWPTTFDQDYAACVEASKPVGTQIAVAEAADFAYEPVTVVQKSLSDSATPAFDSWFSRTYEIVWSQDFDSAAPGFLLFFR